MIINRLLTGQNVQRAGDLIKAHVKAKLQISPPNKFIETIVSSTIMPLFKKDQPLAFKSY